MPKLKVAIIGLGHQAIEDHIPGILSSDLAELRAVCDSDKEKVAILSEKLKVKGYTDHVALFANEKLDFVIIVTPHDTHAKIATDAAIKGVHVLKEKPFAQNLTEALNLESLFNTKNINLSITLQRRFNPIYTTFFQLLDQIGKPLFMEMKYALFIKNPHEGWRGKRDLSGGGCILDMGYHMIDMLLWYFGLPQKVYADFSSVFIDGHDSDVEDNAVINFGYANGFHGSLILSRYHSPKTEYIKVIGSKGSIIIERGKIIRFREDGEIAESLIRENSWPTAASNQIDYFCKVILGQKENLSNPKKHLEHMSFIEACYLSKIEGRFINPWSLLN